jgi:hypothetical protein
LIWAAGNYIWDDMSLFEVSLILLKLSVIFWVIDDFWVMDDFWVIGDFLIDWRFLSSSWFFEWLTIILFLLLLILFWLWRFDFKCWLFYFIR